jgi:hypothetical protein
MPASDHRIRRTAAELLGTDRLTADALFERLRAAGVEVGEDGIERLEAILDDSSDFMPVGESWVLVAPHVDGTRWVTIVDVDDAKQGVLRLDPDLCVLAWWCLDRRLRLGDSDSFVSSHEAVDEDVLVGPPGWLDRFAGRRAVVRIAGESIHLSSAREPGEVAPALVDAVTTVFARAASHETLQDGFGDDAVDLTQVTLETLMWEALVAHHDALTGSEIPPVDELLDAAGLRRCGHTVLRGATDPDDLRRWRLRNRISSAYRLDGDQVDWAELVIALSTNFMAREHDWLGSHEDVPAMATLVALALEDPSVCRALLGYHLDEGAPVAELAEFARAVAGEVPQDGSAGLRWLEGRALDLAGDSVSARAAFEAAVAAGADHDLALAGLAGFVADEGDAVGAVALLSRTSVTDDEDDHAIVALFDEVDGYARHRPRARAARNAPCPCGSGRKYKVCHLGKERHELIDRGPWLYMKQRRFLRDHERTLVSSLASTVSASARRGVGFLMELHHSELIADLALCEGGVSERFLAERDAVLPDDEALLAARWQLVERSLFEVEAARPTEIELRDLRTGERLVVTNTNAESQTRRGDLLLGRPLPIGDTWRAYSGFVKVGRSLRDEILDALDEPDPFAIAELVGRCLAPPLIQNTDAHPLRFHELTWRVPDATAARDALDGHGALTSDDGTYRLVRDSKNQRETVILTLELEGDQLRAEVNSDPRYDEVIELVATLLPDAELIDHDVRELSEVLEADRSRSEPARPNMLDDPDMADVREEIIAEVERRWISDPVPALDGLTPLEAAADPIGRQALERLLDSFDGGPGLMDAQRLRRTLGLQRHLPTVRCSSREPMRAPPAPGMMVGCRGSSRRRCASVA